MIFQTAEGGGKKCVDVDVFFEKNQKKYHLACQKHGWPQPNFFLERGLLSLNRLNFFGGVFGFFEELRVQ